MTQMSMINADLKSFLILSNPRHPRCIHLKFLFALLLGLVFSQIVVAQTGDVVKYKPYPTLKDSTVHATTKDNVNHMPPYNLFLNQEYSTFSNDFIGDYIDNKSGVEYSLPEHKTFKPWIQSDFESFYACPIWGPNTHSLLYRKVYLENLFIVHDTASKFYATIDPLFNFQGSMDLSDSNKKYTQNTRGILIQGNVGSKFAFSTIFWENQASLPWYLQKFVEANYVVPGYGRPKSFGKNSYDYSMSEAYLSYAFSNHFAVQGGYGKNFIGDGYRSLLLSDNTFAYPYLRFTTTFWHLQYTNLYTVFMDPFSNRDVTVVNIEGLIQRKAGAFQYLSWNIVPQVEWGLFQGMIWTAGDQFNHTAFNFNYFDPIIGVNSAVYGLGNTNNVLLGSTIKYKICKNVMTYGQLLVDDFPKNGDMHSIYNKTGYQAGVKYYNKFGEVQVEYNQVRPYTYSSSDSLENYSHYDQSLADPLGANFKEFIGIVNLRYHHFSVHLQGNYAQEGLDTSYYSQGNNIFLPDTRGSKGTDVAMLQGLKSTMMYMDFHISYLMNPRTNMNFTIGVSRRTLTNNLYTEQPMTLFYVGFRTSIENMYTDF